MEDSYISENRVLTYLREKDVREYDYKGPQIKWMRRLKVVGFQIDGSWEERPVSISHRDKRRNEWIGLT